MPSQTFNIFHTINKVDLSEIYVIISIFFEDEILVYRERANIGVV